MRKENEYVKVYSIIRKVWYDDNAEKTILLSTSVKEEFSASGRDRANTTHARTYISTDVRTVFSNCSTSPMHVPLMLYDLYSEYHRPS